MNELAWYFLKLGSFGFGGPAALVGYMRRDLVEALAGVGTVASALLWMKLFPALRKVERLE